MEGGVLHGGLPAVAVGGGGGRGGGGGGRGRGRGHRVVRLPRRSTFVSVSRRVIVALVTLVVEIYHISGKDSTNLQKALKMLAPITSMYSVVEVFKKYTNRGREEGNLLNYGPYYYFEEEGERIWHSPTSWEVLSLLFALLHAASSIFNFLKAANGWEFGGAVSSSHPFVFSTLFVCVLVTEFCSTF